MRRTACPVFALFLASCAAAPAPESLGNIGDGKTDSFGIVDKQIQLDAGETKHFTFTADASFRISVTQPGTPVSERPMLGLALSAPDGSQTKSPPAAEPSLVVDVSDAGTFDLAVTDSGQLAATAVLNVRPLGGFGQLPNPNALHFPDASWQPPALDAWPSTYVIFNNPGCGRACTFPDQNANASRAVMIKLLATAIRNVNDGGIVRVSNYNISSSASTGIVVDALIYAMQQRHATVKIVMDDAQNIATSKTTWLSQQGAQVKFLAGLSYTNSAGPAVGIMHSKIVAVDDTIVFTGSNNFSASGFITNEENSIVLRAPDNATRIASFLCDIDTMFATGVDPGQPQIPDDQRTDKIAALDQCNGSDVWFPPSGTLTTGASTTSAEVTRAIASARHSLAFAPDMMANPGFVSSILSRARAAKAAGESFRVRLVLDASSEALGNPAFGDCLTQVATREGLDIDAHYWHGNPDIFQLMHHKFMIVDGDDTSGAILYNGSANYSVKAMTYSFENVTRYSGAQYRAIVDAFSARFAKMFADSKDKAAIAADGVNVPSCPLDISSL